MSTLINVYDIKRYVDNKTFKSGLNLSGEQDLALDIMFNKKLSYYKISSSAKGPKKDFNMYVNLKLNEKYNVYEIKDSACSCVLGDRCEHVSALLINLSKLSLNELILLMQGDKKDSNGTSKSSKEILVLEQKILDRYSQLGSKDPRYELLPIIVFNKGKIFLEFKIGNLNSHLYSIVDVYEFYQRFETNETYEYSSKFSCIHKLKYIEEKIPGLNDFLFAKIRNNKNFIDSLTTYNKTNTTRFVYDKRYIEITENDFGILFNYMLDKKMYIKYVKDKKTSDALVNCMFDDLSIHLNIDKKRKYYKLSVVNNTDYTYYGDNFIASLIDNCLKVTQIKNSDDARFLNLILQKELSISINEFDRVYDNVIKDRLQFVKLDEQCSFIEEDIDSVHLHVYVDVNKSGHLVINHKLFRKDEEIKDNREEFLKRRNVLALNDCLGRYLNGNKYVVTKIDDIFEFYNSTLDVITEISDAIYLSEEFKKVKVVKNPKIQTGVRLESDLLKIDVTIDEEKIADLNKIINDYSDKKKYYRLENGDFLLLESEQFRDLEEVISSVKNKNAVVDGSDITVSKTNALYVEELFNNSNVAISSKNEDFEKLIHSFKDLKSLDYKVPKLQNATLRDYQIEGFKFLKLMQDNKFGVILADDMGLGKTIQIIAILQTLKGVHIVICPSSLVYNWMNELNKFAPSLKVGIVKNDRESRLKVIKDYKKYDILITSYDTLKRDIESYEDIEFNTIVIDEAHYIKNPNTKGSKVVKQLNGLNKFALTGTPIENNLTELWSIFDFVLPGYLSTYYQFHKNYEVPIVKYRCDDTLEELTTLVKPFILRRMKTEVLTELPEKMESVMYCEFDQEQKDVYDSYVLQMKNELSDSTDSEFENNKIKILSMIMKLRQVCCDPNLILEGKQFSSAKLDLAMDLIQNSIASNRKVLLFSQFTSMLSIISKSLEKENIKHHMLTGSVKSKDRMKMVDEFNSDDSQVFLISLKAGGTGLNLTKADVVIHYDPWWNVSSENQATDRAYRIGQKNKVNVYRLIAKDTIEEKIINIQKNKKQLSDSIIKDNDNPLNTLNKQEFIDIITNK